jgi:hypothetical protein
MWLNREVKKRLHLPDRSLRCGGDDATGPFTLSVPLSRYVFSSHPSTWITKRSIHGAGFMKQFSALSTLNPVRFWCCLEIVFPEFTPNFTVVNIVFLSWTFLRSLSSFILRLWFLCSLYISRSVLLVSCLSSVMFQRYWNSCSSF